MIAGLVGGVAGGLARHAFDEIWGQGQSAVFARNRRRERAHVGAPNPGHERLTGEPEARERRSYARDLEQRNGTHEWVENYAFGSTIGVAYGALAEVWDPATSGGGLGLGAALALVGEEGLKPTVGWAAPPRSRPPVSHARGVLSCLVFGVTCEVVRAAVRRAL